MPIQLDINHPDRIVVGVARGSIGLQDYGAFVAEIAKAGVTHYRKIIDIADAESATIDADVLLAFDRRMSEVSKDRPRGPLAFVVDRQRGDLARAFKALASTDRPIEVFGSIHEARRWLRSLPMVD